MGCGGDCVRHCLVLIARSCGFMAALSVELNAGVHSGCCLSLFY